MSDKELLIAQKLREQFAIDLTDKAIVSRLALQIALLQKQLSPNPTTVAGLFLYTL
jgi:hypothetical protein